MTVIAMDSATLILAAAYAVISIAGLAWASYVGRKVEKRCDELRKQVRGKDQ